MPIITSAKPVCTRSGETATECITKMVILNHIKTLYSKSKKQKDKKKYCFVSDLTSFNLSSFLKKQCGIYKCAMMLNVIK